MVRIIPSRLKPHSSSNTNSSSNSRSSSPLRSGKGDNMLSADGNKEAWAGLVLKAIVIRARNLAAKDRGGTSDPYLQLTCGDSKFTTHCVPKTLDPEWNVICTIPITGVENLLLDAICWDKDRFGKDYLGEFDLALEEIFANDKTAQDPTWYPLQSKRGKKKKDDVVSGEVLLQCTIFDANDKDATDAQILEKLRLLAGTASDNGSRNVTPTRTPILAPTTSSKSAMEPQELQRSGSDNSQDDDYDDELLDDDEDATPEDEDPNKPETIEKRKRRLRIRGLKRKKRQNPYEFTHSGSDVVGLIFLEIISITDLPPEHNLTRTSFDMDPFVVASLGKKTYRTKYIRHNLNPIFNEKMLFQVLGHEQSYSFSFTVIDRDKYSGNDFIASSSLPLKELTEKAPKADPQTGLYDLKDPPEYEPAKKSSKFSRLTISRSPSQQSLKSLKGRPPLTKSPSATSTSTQRGTSPGAPISAPSSNLLQPGEVPSLNAEGSDTSAEDDSDFINFTIPLKMKNQEKWEDKHNPQLYIRAKYMPYPALRQQFWRAMLRQYDTDESGDISKVELTTMLDTLGSTLRESTIDSFFQRFPHKADDETPDLTIDEAVVCLEDQLQKKAQGITDKMKHMLPDADRLKATLHMQAQASPSEASTPLETPNSEPSSFALSPESSDVQGQQPATSTISVPDLNTPGEEGVNLGKDDLNDDREEHVVEIRECPICHQPRLNKRSDADIITHIATCASQDWRQVNSLMMGGFVTASQAQRKWYSKVITKISYGGYKLGANSANILVQDRLTGQINEEKMSVYVRLGIRLLYKGLKSRDMEKKRIRKLLKGLSIKQGKKYDDPSSKSEIPGFIEFHNLDMSEVLLPMEQFKNFNEFFYRALKPDARPCSAPEDPNILVSPADCRSVVFNRMDQATKIWVKGREFSVKRLLGDAYAEDAKRYENGSMGIFRLAPQDYHRFHIPVDGVLREPKLIAGEYYTVNPMAIRSALDVYGENVRVICPIDSPKFGRVMVICVGAMMVGSTVITRREGEEVKRAEELGYFKFGGSTIVLLFEDSSMVYDADLVDNSNSALETLVRAGMSIGHSPDVPQWTPDMPKNANQITEADKQEAHRRIRGGGGGPDGMGGLPAP